MNISYIKSPPRKFLKILYSFFFLIPCEQCPNSDPKQCTVTKLGWLHSAHTENPGRAHTARTVPMSWALLLAQQAYRASSQRRSRAYWVCTFRNTPRQPAPRPRPHFDVATSRQPESCRDIKSMSRHHPEHSRSQPQISCRDTVSPAQPQARSRHQNQVATSWTTNLCRNIVFLSRPRSCPA